MHTREPQTAEESRLRELAYREAAKFLARPLCDGCGGELITPREVRTYKCMDCEAQDERMKCWNCRKEMHWCYSDGRAQFCSDRCEERYWKAALLYD